MLTFKAQPDFEDPADADTDNVYEVTVVVSDPAGNSDEVDVRVTVTNVPETGSITFSTLQPKAGIPLTAALNDADGGITEPHVAVVRRNLHRGRSGSGCN